MTKGANYQSLGFMLLEIVGARRFDSLSWKRIRNNMKAILDSFSINKRYSIQKKKDQDFLLRSKPLLKSHLVTFFNYDDSDEAYLLDVLSGKILIKLKESEHAALELFNGFTSLDDIIEKISVIYSKGYNDEELKIRLLKLYRELHDKEFIWSD